MDCSLKEKEPVEAFAGCIQNADSQQARTECLADAEAYRLELVGEGTSRMVLRSTEGSVIEEGCVVKVAKSPDTAPEPGHMNVVPESHEGREQNRREAETWESLPDELHDEFFPVLDYDEEDYDWLTMPEASGSAGRLGLWWVNRQLDKYGWDCDDMDADNIGRDGVRPKAIDYGLGCTK